MTTSYSVYIYKWHVSETYVVSIRGYGVDIYGCRVCVCVEDFQPHVYIEADAVKNIPNIPKFNIEEKGNLYNFKPSKQNFYKIFFRTKIALNKFIHEHKLEQSAHEQNASVLLQFITQQNLSQVGWVEFSGIETFDENLCDKNYECVWTDVKPTTGPFMEPLVCAFDCEVYSTIPGAMPSNKPGDEIFQISVVFSDGDSFLLSLEGIDYEEDIAQFASEKDLLGAFIGLINDKRPWILTGYNILGFDIEYIINRCTRLFLLDNLLNIGYGNMEAELKTVKWSSGALGIQEFVFLDWEGIVILDLYPIVKRDYKFSNYKLETVAQNLLGRGKDPITVKDIIKAYETKLMQQVGFYCVKDSQLCLELAVKMGTWIGLVEMANICNVQPMILYIQGQQIKIFSQVYKYCHDNNIVVNTDAYKVPSGMKYSGAYVMEPVPGLYRNVVPFDFSALYPSIIITENICYSTIAPKDAHDSKCNVFEWEDHIGCDHDPKIVTCKRISDKINNLENDIKMLRTRRDMAKGVALKKSVQNIINSKRQEQKPLRKARVDVKAQKSMVICTKNKFRFLKASEKRGVIPTIIQSLLANRKTIKSLLKTEQDPLKRTILDKKQLAYKVSANSMYGAMGVRSGYLPYMPGAMTITHCGREAIKKSLKIIEADFSGSVIYVDTDSNYVQFPNIKQEALWTYAIEVAREVSSHFPETMTLEFEEKIYTQFILMGKKKYAYSEWVQPCGSLESDTKIGYKGIILARRDNAKIVRDLYLECLKLIINRGQFNNIATLAVDWLSRLGCGFPPDDFVLTKSVGNAEGEYNYIDGTLGNYKVKSLALDYDIRDKQLAGKSEQDWYNSQLPAHMQLVKRMAKRGISVAMGSRVEIVVLDKQSVKLGDKMEDLEYFKANMWRLKLDKNYYIKSMINPIDQLIETVYGKVLIVFLAECIERKTACLNQLKAKFKPKLVFKQSL